MKILVTERHLVRIHYFFFVVQDYVSQNWKLFIQMITQINEDEVERLNIRIRFIVFSRKKKLSV